MVKNLTIKPISDNGVLIQSYSNLPTSHKISYDGHLKNLDIKFYKLPYIITIYRI